MLNKDGLTAGEPVDFATMKRIENERRKGKERATSKTSKSPVSRTPSTKKAKKTQSTE